MKQTWWAYFLLFSTLPAFAQTAANADLAARVVQLEKRFSSRAVMELLDRVDQLQTEVQQLRGDVDKIRHDQGRIQDRQQNLYLDLDKRLLDLESAGTNGSVPALIPEPAKKAEIAQAPSPSEPPVSQPKKIPQDGRLNKDTGAEGDKDVTESGDGELLYQEAFVYLNNGRYDDAIGDFTRLIESFPSSEFADNAQYWLGETYYVKRDFDAARAHFNKVIERYPDSSKVPDALVKMGYIEYELASWKTARKILKSVVQQYPESNAAELAQDRLDRMRKERH